MGSKHNGFTFLEVLAALAIVAIALVALLRLHLISIRSTQRSDTLTRAGLLAQEKMAQLVAGEYPPIGSQDGTVSQDGLDLSWQTAVRAFALPDYKLEAPSKLREVSVDVRWKNGGHDKHFRLATLVADRDLP